MTVTQQRIGTGITERLSVSIHGPWDEATRDWAPRMAEAYNETYIFECRAAPWERWAQEVFAKEKLPPWDKYVRICADGSWADNLPEELLQRLQDMADGSWARATSLRICSNASRTLANREKTSKAAWRLRNVTLLTLKYGLHAKFPRASIPYGRRWRAIILHGLYLRRCTLASSQPQ